VKCKQFLLFLFLISFAVRAVVFGFFVSKNKNYITNDSHQYKQVALHITQGRGIANTDGLPHFYRIAGYPIFLAFFYTLFPSKQTIALWVQLFLTSFIPVLIFFLSLTLFPGCFFVAKIAAFCSVFHIGYVLFSGLMMSDGLWSLFYLLFLIFFFKSFSYYNIFLAGLCLGVASLLRPGGIYLLLFSILFLLFFKITFVKRLKGSLILFLSWLSIVLVWLLRNYLITGCIFFHTLPGVHFLRHVAVPIDMQTSGRSFQKSFNRVLRKEWVDLITKEEKVKKRKLHEIEKCVLGEKLAFRYILKHPFIALKRGVYNVCKTIFFLFSYEIFNIIKEQCHWNYDQRDSFFQRMIKRYFFPPVKSSVLNIIVLLEIVFHIFLLFGFCLGLFKFPQFLTVLPFVLLMLFVTFPCGFARVRLPIEPFLLVISCCYWFNKYET
jgi:hypothetical protein